ncbi:MAG: hypothetical protein OXU36_05280 [Candidatus Poribacteria bacterium]|nr:hypothetical protein [Candidatus Poribacteria bacterium]
MVTSTQKFFLLTVGLLFCILGCARDRAHVPMHDHISPPMEVHETAHAEVSFEENILPILTSRCALAGCHVADGPHGLDFRTYESFIAGGEHGPAFIPGNAEESEVVEQIVLGNMPPAGPPLSPTEIQLFVTWINQQETRGDIVKHGHGDAHAEDMDGDMDDDHDDAEDAHDDMDAAHDGMDDDHDDDDDNGHDDNDDNGHDDNDDNGHDDHDDHDDDDN